jgi:2-dehydro-3-deoxyphosphogluconate aldolase/(4S)-4-hydroxy-2-oxoglutarate aldolase
MNFREKVRSLGIVPVLNIRSEDDGVRIAEILLEEGLGIMELTFRNPRAGSVITAVRRRFPEMLLGAGTVRNPEQLAASLDTGVDFIVSPSIVPSVMDAWLEARSADPAVPPYLPGICTPREAEEALSYGLSLLKFFPAVPAGGVPMLKAMGATHGDVEFMPTGGIGKENLPDFLALPNVIACGASSIVPGAMTAAGDFDGIRSSIASYVRSIGGTGGDSAGGSINTR